MFSPLNLITGQLTNINNNREKRFFCILNVLRYALAKQRSETIHSGIMSSYCNNTFLNQIIC